jgi:signal transduction histidine kinase
VIVNLRFGAHRAKARHLSPRKKAAIAFVSALVLLTIGAIATAISIWNLLNSVEWLAHSYDVEVALANVDSDLTEAARNRAVYVNTGDPSVADQFDATIQRVPAEIDHVIALVSDNAVQRPESLKLKDLGLKRIAILQQSVTMRRNGSKDAQLQATFQRESLSAGIDQSELVHSMQREEQALIMQRRKVSRQLFKFFLGLLAATFVVSILLFWLHYRLLRAELEQREAMEESTRRLSARVLELQDEERRKFARELHDSLGQILTAAKLNMSALVKKYSGDAQLAETEEFLDQAVLETRTISYLLHPPLLDELGFASAAQWYVQGFSERSGIKVETNISAGVSRLPRPMELVLFRVLQESLTNVLRHSKSSRADIALFMARRGVVLRVRDYGVGIPPATLENFLSTGTEVGVGLAGMRERVREQGGQFDVISSPSGTTLTVTMPLPRESATPLYAASPSA